MCRPKCIIIPCFIEVAATQTVTVVNIFATMGFVWFF